MKKKDIIKSVGKKYSLPIKIGAAALIIGGGIFAIVKISRYTKGKKLQKERESLIRQEGDDALANLTGRRITDATAKNVAEQLYVAMNGVGTDTTTIKRLLVDDNLTSADLIAIHQAFGVKEYGFFGKPWFGNGEKLDLRGWIKEEISASSELYSLLVSKFRQAGLTM